MINPRYVNVFDIYNSAADPDPLGFTFLQMWTLFYMNTSKCKLKLSKISREKTLKMFQIKFFISWSRIWNRKTYSYYLPTINMINGSGTCTEQHHCTRPQPMVTCSCSTSCWTTTAPRRSPISTCGSRSMLPPAGVISKPWRSSLRKIIKQSKLFLIVIWLLFFYYIRGVLFVWK